MVVILLMPLELLDGVHQNFLFLGPQNVIQKLLMFTGKQHLTLCFYKCSIITLLRFPSFAVVLWEIVTRQLPFAHYDFNYEVLEAIRSGERPVFPEGCADMLKSLIQDCWQQEPTQRPNFRDIKDRLKEMYSSLSE